MRVILPPSETKNSGGGSFHLDLETLSFKDQLTDLRLEGMRILKKLSVDEPAALKALKLGSRSKEYLAHNLVLESSPTLPAIERYTGVLFDELGYTDLSSAAKNWVGEHVYIQSALFGLINSADGIPIYRVSSNSNLKPFSFDLKKLHREAHKNLDFGSAFVLDLRSKDYAALAPLPGAHYLEIVSRSADGVTRALNHFNKRAKGDLVKKLALSSPKIANIEQLFDWGRSLGLEFEVKDDSILLITNLGSPKLS